MFDMSWGEVMLIGGVALVVIGPKELPKALRTVGQVTSKLKRMAGEFHAQFNEAMREAELDEVRRDVEGINRSVSNSLNTGFNPIQTIRDEIKGAVDAKSATTTAPTSETSAYTDPDASTAAVTSTDLAEATAQLEAARLDAAAAEPAPETSTASRPELPPDVPELAPPDPAPPPAPAAESSHQSEAPRPAGAAQP